MKIKRMRLVLPARLSSTAQVDARMIATAAAQALQGTTDINGPVTVQVQTQGQPAKAISQSVFVESCRQARILKRGT